VLSGVSHHSQAASRSRLLRLPRRTARLAGLKSQLRFLNLLSSAPPCALCVHGTTCFGGCKNQGALTSCLCSLQHRSTANFLAVLKRVRVPKTEVLTYASSKNKLKTKVFVKFNCQNWKRRFLYRQSSTVTTNFQNADISLDDGDCFYYYKK